MQFSGSKLALFLGDALLVILRDDRPDIPYPGHWDLPGGGREGDESPATCALRETWEETGLKLHPDDLSWSRSYERARGTVWFFAAHLSPTYEAQVQLGDEGQCCRLMAPQGFVDHPLAVPHLSEQVQSYLLLHRP